MKHLFLMAMAILMSVSAFAQVEGIADHVTLETKNRQTYFAVPGSIRISATKEKKKLFSKKSSNFQAKRMVKFQDHQGKLISLPVNSLTENSMRNLHVAYNNQVNRPLNPEERMELFRRARNGARVKYVVGGVLAGAGVIVAGAVTGGIAPAVLFATGGAFGAWGFGQDWAASRYLNMEKHEFRAVDDLHEDF
ncbi:hypothetical protein [Persicobacter psychrovividus]|uniref:Glycine zipper family protein n=1 Tax=Persicobacter psychrovividus TaxID=387638 RepID=A0ABM7VFI7_9BACT|nr:hypothetical protein PEPS_19780 [Persicobacter psychrovividus]